MIALTSAAMGLQCNNGARSQQSALARSGVTDPGNSQAVLPPVVERFVRQLVVAAKSVTMYPASSAIPREASRQAVNTLTEALREYPEVRFIVTRDGLIFEETPVFPGHRTFTAFAREFYNRLIAEVRFHAGIEPQHLVDFLTVLSLPPEEIAETGGFDARLWELNIGTISVSEMKITLVDAETPDFLDEEMSLTASEVDDLIAAARRGSLADQVTIARFIRNPLAVRNYLLEKLAAGGATALDQMSDSFMKLAQLAANAEGSERDEQMHALSQAVMELAEDIRRDMVANHLLPEARSSEPIGAVVRQMDIEQVCRMLASAAKDGEMFRSAMVRAVRGLSAVAGVDHNEVVAVATGVMLENGLGTDEAAAVIDEATPRQLVVRGEAASALSRPTDAVVALIDSAPASTTLVGDESPEIVALKDEARRGITDGDVVITLVSLVTLDPGPVQFNATMTRLEDALDVLIERGELQVAAEVTATLGNAAKNPELSEEQRKRLIHAIARFARANEVKSIADALRLYPPGSPEHTSAMRLIKMLGPLAIKPLLEQLANEQDMAGRKSLVDTISGIADDYIEELGEHLADPRWYFVRNVVSILCSTKSPIILPYVERTLRHSEARVRREAIRGLSQQTDRRASQMLIQALNDEDSQNVQLAARFIAQRDVTAAIPALQLVATGDGRGSRENPARIEAIEALGRLGATEALPALRALATSRSIFGRARNRELRTVAKAAIDRIQNRGGGR